MDVELEPHVEAAEHQKKRSSKRISIEDLAEKSILGAIEKANMKLQKAKARMAGTVRSYFEKRKRIARRSFQLAKAKSEHPPPVS